jgi:hypothetical protein
MIEQHRTPSTRTRFPRSVREATGYHMPSRPMQLYRPAKDPDRIVWRICVICFVILMGMKFAGVDL